MASQSTNKVDVINADTNTVTSSISLAAGTGPTCLAISSDGSRVYAGGNGVAVINGVTDTLITTIGAATTTYDLELNPAGTRLYAARDSSNAVGVIDTSTNTVVTTITGFSNPRGVLVNKAGTKLYINCYGTHTIEVYNTSNNSFSKTISGVNSYPQIGLVENPAGTKIYSVVGAGSVVRVVDTSNDTLSGSIAGTFSGWDIALSPDGSKIAVGQWGSAVDILSTSGSGSVLTTLTTGMSTPIGVAFNPKGNRLYIANSGNHTVTVIRSALDPPSSFFSMF